MKNFRLNIDGKEVLGLPGQTILEVAKENDIFIPTLCFDERTAVYGSCGICVVEVEGNCSGNGDNDEHRKGLRVQKN